MVKMIAPDLFMSHSSADKEIVEQLAEGLLEEFGIHCWIDGWMLTASANWRVEIEKGLASCRGCLIILGSSGWGHYHRLEAEIALERRSQEPGFTVILVLLEGAQEEHVRSLGNFGDEAQRVTYHPGNNESDALLRIATGLRGEQPFPLGRPRLSPYIVRRDARRWKASAKNKGDRDTSLLYRGGALDKAAELQTKFPILFEPETIEFLLASERYQAQQSRRTRGAILIVLIIVSLLGALALFNRNLAISRLQAATKQANVVVNALARDLRGVQGASTVRESLVESACALLEELLGRRYTREDIAHATTLCLLERGLIALDREGPAAATAPLEEAEAIFQRLSTKKRSELAETTVRLESALLKLREGSISKEKRQEPLETFVERTTQNIAKNQTTLLLKQSLIEKMFALVRFKLQAGHLREAREVLGRARMLVDALGIQHGTGLADPHRSEADSLEADVQWVLGNLAKHINAHRRAFARYEELLVRFPKDINYTLQAVDALIAWGRGEREQGNFDNSLKILARAETIFKRLNQERRQDFRSKIVLASLLKTTGRTYQIRAHMAATSSPTADQNEALRLYRRNFEIIAQLLQLNPKERYLREYLAEAYERLGDVALAQKNFDEALEAYTMMQSIAKSLYIEDPKDSYSLTRLMVSYGSEADVYFQRGDFVQATAKTEKAMELQSRLTQLVPSPERHQEAFIGHVMLASNYAYQENWLQCASHRDVAERLFKTFSLVVQKVPEIAYREAHLRQLVQVYPRCRID